MNGFRIPLGDWIELALDWVIDVFGPLFDAIRTVFRGAYDGLEWVLTTPPFWGVLIVLAGLAWLLRAAKSSELLAVAGQVNPR